MSRVHFKRLEYTDQKLVPCSRTIVHKRAEHGDWFGFGVCSSPFMPSPIERMIDAATGYKPAPPKKKRTLSTSEEKQVAADAGNEVIWYIDRMYPSMWDSVPKSARTSVKNIVHNRVISILLNYEFNPRARSACGQANTAQRKTRK